MVFPAAIKSFHVEGTSIPADSYNVVLINGTRAVILVGKAKRFPSILIASNNEVL